MMISKILKNIDISPTAYQAWTSHLLVALSTIVVDKMKELILLWFLKDELEISKVNR